MEKFFVLWNLLVDCAKMPVFKFEHTVLIVAFAVWLLAAVIMAIVEPKKRTFLYRGFAKTIITSRTICGGAFFLTCCTWSYVLLCMVA